MAKASEVRGLSRQDSVHQAAGKILWTRFEDMWALRDAILTDGDIEAVHDMRVASRRLRTAMQTFRPCFGGRSYRVHYRCVRELADLLGEVRDRDVLLEELQGDLAALPTNQQAGLEELMSKLREEREGHRESLHDLIRRLDRRAYDRDFLRYIARHV